VKMEIVVSCQGARWKKEEIWGVNLKDSRIKGGGQQRGGVSELWEQTMGRKIALKEEGYWGLNVPSRFESYGTSRWPKGAMQTKKRRGIHYEICGPIAKDAEKKGKRRAVV